MIMKTVFYIFLLLCPLFLFSQNPFPAKGEVFKDEVIPRIDILIPEDSLNALYAPGNEESNYHYHATFIFDNGDILDTLTNIGFRFRGNTSRHSDKKSFKISFNTYEQGRQWYGLEKLNINGEHNDPSVSRAKLGWDLCKQMEIPAPRANHVDLYINGDYWGLYINVEHIDEEFVELRFGNKEGNLYKCLWPADLNYKGANPDLYKAMQGGRRVYALKTNEDLDNYEDIAHFIDVLNNTPIANLACELDQVFNIDSYLRSIAMDILTGNWDGPIYNKNNFYLYKNEATGKFEYIPYDLDNTFGIDWFNIDWQYRDIYEWDKQNENRPIYTRILEVPEFRNRFSYYMNQFIQNIYKPDLLEPYLDEMRTLISTSAQLDPFRPQDYGFSFQDFENSFDQDIPYNHVSIGIKPFINERRFSAFQQIDFQNIEPIITQVSNNHPNEFQFLNILAKVKDNISVEEVNVCFYANGIGLTCLEMLDDGLNNDGTAGDGIYGINIPSFNEPTTIEFYVSATDNTGLESKNPICSFKTINIGSSTAPLVINEFMASNDDVFFDDFGEYDDWIEIFNASDVPTFMGNYFLSDNQNNPDKWQFPDVWIQPEDYLIIWADKDEDQGVLHANFKLSADGEFIGIFDSAANNFALIDGYDYGPTASNQAIGRIPNATGPFQAVFPTPGAFNEPTNVGNGLQRTNNLLEIYPNPFSDYIYLKLNPITSTMLNFQLTNSYGHIVFETTKTIGANELKIETTNLPNGLYFMTVLENGKMLSTKKVCLLR